MNAKTLVLLLLPLLVIKTSLVHAQSGTCPAESLAVYGLAEIETKNGVTVNSNGVPKIKTSNNAIGIDGAISNPTISLPSLPAINFQSSWSDANGDLTPGNYDKWVVNANNNVTITAGTYNINEVDIKGNAVITTTGGPVIINVAKFDMDDGSRLNAGGAAANLTVNYYGNSSSNDNKFHLHDDVQFTGIIFSSFTDDKVEIKKDVVLTGGIFTAGEVKLEDRAAITYGAAEQAAAATVLGCTTIDQPEMFAGRVTVCASDSTATFTAVSFNQPFSVTPLVFTLPTNDESDPALLRIKNVTPTGFEIAQVESQGSNGTSGATVVDFLAIVPGEYNLAGGAKMDVVSFSTNTFQGNSYPSNDRGWDDVDFPSGFSAPPAIIAEIQTMNNETGSPPGSASMPFLGTTIRSVTGNDFEFALERAETFSGTLDIAEQVGYIAIDAGKTGQLVPGIAYQSVLTLDEIPGGTCTLIAINPGESGLPLVVASQNLRGGNNGGWLRRCSISGTSVGFIVDEDIDKDLERSHTAEQAGILALDGNFVTIDSCGGSCGTLTAVGIKIDNGGSNSSINTITEALTIHEAWIAAYSPATGLIAGDTYNVAASGSSTVDRIDFGGDLRDYPGTLPYPYTGASTGESDSNFLVHTSGTLSLRAGDYTIYVSSDDGFSFVMNSVSGSAVSFNKFGSSGAGASNELRYEGTTGDSNTGGSFTLATDSVFTIAAIFFELGGGDFLEIAIANNIGTSSSPSDYEILRDGALSNKVTFGQCYNTSNIAHYAVNHSGSAVSCAPYPVSISAVDAGGNSIDIPTGTQLTLSTDIANDGWSNPGGSGASYTLPTSSASVNFELRRLTPATLEIDVDDTAGFTDDDGNRNDDTVVFTDAGFVFYADGISSSIGTQLSAKTSSVAPGNQQITLKAVQSSPADPGVCEALINNATANIGMAYQCSDPGSCATPSDAMIINTTPIDASTAAAYTNVPLSFNAAGESTLTLQYADAGLISLRANADLAVSNSTGTANVNGSSNTFLVKPAGICVQVVESGSACSAGDASCSMFKPAGQDFNLEVSGRAWVSNTESNTAFCNNNITKNFVHSNIALNSNLIAPGSGGVNAALSVTMTATGATGTVAQPISVSEVGVFTFTASPPVYFTDTLAASTSANVGRFTPSYFDLSGGSITAANTSTTDFTYLGQAVLMNYSLTAKSALAATTQNYGKGNFAKLNWSSVSNNPGAVGTSADMAYGAVISSGSPVSYNSRLAVSTPATTPTWYSGVVNVINLPLIINRTANTEAPVTGMDIGIAVEDGDGIKLSALDLDSATLGSTDTKNLGTLPGNLYYARAFIPPVYGPEIPVGSHFNMPFSIQYFTGSRFTTQNDDSSTAYGVWTSTCADADPTDNLLCTEAPVSIPFASVVGGEDNPASPMTVARPGLTNTGSLNMTIAVEDWLKFDWDTSSAGDENPSALVTFGTYRGHDRIIYWRERFNQ